MASRVGLIAFAVQVFFTCGLTAQTGLLQLAEYFWDVDPGAGNAIALSAQDGGFDEAIENILLNTQELPTAGLHTLGVRMQDGTGSWGSVFQVNIFIDENGSELRQINISAAEYFWDYDPGEGAATPMVVADGNFEEAIEATMFSTSSFPGFGPHTLGIRVLDAEGAWSATFTTVVQIDEPSTDLRQINIQSAEYFWNNDPGEGSGTPMIVFDGNFDDAIESISLSTSSFPADGPQVLNIRVMDAEGVWSVAFSTVVFIDEPSTALRDIEITAAEYFWNSDPGQGNGNALIAFDGNFDEALETATMSTGSFPETGPQLLNIRILDAEGAWSPVFSTMVVIDEPSTALREILVTSAELFWDADPGIGNGIPMVAFDSDFDEALEQAYKCTTTFPGPGAHKISFRMRGADQQWSPAFSSVIVIDEPTTALREISLASAEYFWDADPGTGNGNPMFVIDGNFNEAIESVSATATIGLTEGVHVLNVRMKSIDGIWSSLFKAIVVVDEQSEEQRDIYVASAEYWFDTDPGAGSGTPIITEDGAFDDAIEIIKGAEIPVPVTEGMHTLWFRAKDPQGGWGQKFGIVVYMDIDVNGFTTAISGAESICAGIDQIGQHYYALGAEGSTYAWTINGGLITGGQGTAHVTVNWNSGTGQWLSLQQCLDGVCQDDILYVNFQAPVFNTVNVSICEGESYFVANAYRTESGTYVDEFQTALGCDSTVTTYLTVLPHTSSTSYVSICQGESWNAGGANQTTSGTYLDTYQASNGCDSLHYTVLTVHPTYNEQKYVEICPGSSYFAGGNWQTFSGFYSDLYQSVYGCDSLVVTQLVVTNPIHTYEYATICQGESYFAGGQLQTMSGTYVDTFPGICTEIRTTYLTVNPSYNNVVNVDIYNGLSYFAQGEWQTESGTYVDVYQSVLGCDSIITTELNVIDVINHVQYVDICEGETFYAGGALQTETGTYVDVITGACTETLTTYLTVHTSYQQSNEVVICLGQTYYAGGALQSNSGTYFDAYQTQWGCDSLVTTYLTVLEFIDSEQNLAICEGDSLFVGGAWQHTSGVYVDVNSEGPCVEVLTTTLVVHPNEEVELEINICEGESWFAGGAWQTTSGTYVDQYQTLFGCDSTVTTLLTVTSNSSAPFVIDLGDGLVQASQVASGYQWTVDGLGCDILTFTAGQVLDLTAYCTSEAYVVSLQTSTSGCISPSSDEVTVILADCTQLNDYCSGAVNLVVDGPALFDSNQCATNFGENPGYCTDDIGRSVWYKFTATSGLDVDISIDNITPITADFNPKLEVFSGGCLSMTQLACVNVAGSGGSESVSLDNLAAGGYLIRVSGFLIQKGAYSISVEKSGSCLGDFDFNGVVNVSDVLIFSSQFGCTSNCTVDLDGNGSINVTDLLILSSVFGNVCP